MIYPHHQKAIDYIINKLKDDPDVLALLISGSVAHGFNDINSDVDLNIVISEKSYNERNAERKLLYWEDASGFYENGYFDGKYITLDYLSMVAERGNEPSRFALHDVIIAFDKTNSVEGYIKEIGNYNKINEKGNTVRFLSQFDSWKWFCGEALKRENKYLLDLSVSKLILFGSRLILLENKLFFPYHKWLLKVLENAPDKPDGLIYSAEKLLNDKTPENINEFYELIKGYKNWTNGAEYNCFDYFMRDVETVWMDEKECIDNI